ncbi:hypothetical protein PoB_000298200 [Plakobranchus ocellatus]|uniref:Uncharacterized protein n=1 Tax=Plakobranchus ocellatus TaxID=259542 RepID=A0AAV3Y320_9GAST|nr:hypothetical protein PoB_000298200 [Plakobranchus ocellatus]
MIIDGDDNKDDDDDDDVDGGAGVMNTMMNGGGEGRAPIPHLNAQHVSRQRRSQPTFARPSAMPQQAGADTSSKCSACIKTKEIPANFRSTVCNASAGLASHNQKTSPTPTGSTNIITTTIAVQRQAPNYHHHQHQYHRNSKKLPQHKLIHHRYKFS